MRRLLERQKNSLSFSEMMMKDAEVAGRKGDVEYWRGTIISTKWVIDYINDELNREGVLR